MKNDLMTVLGAERPLVIEAVMALERALWRTLSEGACRVSLDDSSPSQFQIDASLLAQALRVELDSGGFQFRDDAAATMLVQALVDSLPTVDRSTKATRIIDSASFVTLKRLRASLRPCFYRFADLKYFAFSALGSATACG